MEYKYAVNAGYYWHDTQLEWSICKNGMKWQELGVRESTTLQTEGNSPWGIKHLGY